MSRPIEESILRSLRKITRAVDLYSRQLARQYQLTGPQVVCLRQLQKKDEMMPSELAKTVSLSQATITGILDRLETQSLIKRERCQEDRRRVMVTLTDRGREVALSVPSPLQERFAERLARLPDEEQTAIEGVLKQVVGMMEAEDLEAAPILQSGSLIELQAPALSCQSSS